MALPTITAPEYTVQLKSIKQPVKFRPYTVKEEKIFLMAKESNTPADIDAAVQQVLRNCTFNQIDITKLPSFDVEYLFLQIRSKSVNNVVEMQYQCENMVEKDGEKQKCHTMNSVKILLDEISVTVPDDHTTIVSVNDDITIEFQYPTTQVLSEILSGATDSFAMSSKLVAACIKSIAQKDGTVHESRDYTENELIDFIDSLTLQQVNKCQAFFGSMPTVVYDTTFECRKCGYTEPIHFEGLADFFA